jgi:predicted dehydrogenase
MSQVRSVRAVIVGGGLMGRWHAEGIRKAQGSLLGVVDVDDRIAGALARRYRPAESFRDLEQLFGRIHFDIVHVCTPVGNHQAIAERAIEAGVNLLVEKPVSPDGSGTERLLDLAAARGVLLCPVHQFLFQDGVMKARERLPRIGQLVHLEATFCSAGGAGLADEQQDSVVADILPHPLSLMQEFLPGAALPENWLTIKPQVGELRALAEICGVTLSIFISMQARPTVCALQIFGTHGAIHMDLFHGYTFLESGAVSKAKKVLRPFDLAARRFGAATINLGSRLLKGETAYPGLYRLITSFYDAVRTNGHSPIARAKTIGVARARDVLIERAALVREPKAYSIL